MSISPSDTRIRILEAARRLFHEQGYAATGIATILREAEVNSGSLYHFFPSKEALLVGVLEHYTRLLRPMIMDPAEEKGADPVERIFGLLDLYRSGLEATGCTMGCPIGNLALEVADSHPEVRRLVDQNFSNWISEVESWLKASRDRFPEGLDLRQVAQLVLTVMEGGIMQARAASSLKPFDASVAQLRVYLDLLQERARERRPPAPKKKPAARDAARRRK